MLVFSNVDDDGEIDEKGLSVCPFWIQMQGLPPLWMTEKVGILLRSKEWKVIKVDGGKGKFAGGK